MSAVYFDTETTGLDEQAQIIQVGLIDEAGKILFESLVKCEGKIPAEVTAVHGITDADLDDAPTWPEIHDHVCAILARAEHLYIYNAEYDFRLLNQTAKRHHRTVPMLNNTVCLMNQYAQLFNHGRRKKLVTACHEWGINTADLRPHRAVSDCEMTRRLHIEMANRHK